MRITGSSYTNIPNSLYYCVLFKKKKKSFLFICRSIPLLKDGENFETYNEVFAVAFLDIVIIVLAAFLIEVLILKFE